MVMFGDDPRTEQSYWMVTFHNDGGGGAMEGYDGCHHIAPIVCCGNILKCPVELAEIKWPWRITKYELLTDSGGAGKYRGGLGTHWEAVNEGGKAMAETGAMSGETTTPFGQKGGHGAIESTIYVRRDGKEEPVHTMSMFPLQPGDVLGTKSSGGGGVGEPFERPVEKVREDVVNGYVSVEKARRDYGVVLDPKTLVVNTIETAKARGEH